MILAQGDGCRHDVLPRTARRPARRELLALDQAVVQALRKGHPFPHLTGGERPCGSIHLAAKHHPAGGQHGDTTDLREALRKARFENFEVGNCSRIYVDSH